MRLESIIHHPVLDALAWTLIHSLWQAALVAVAVGLLLDLAKKASPGLRYNIAIVGQALIPVLAIITYLHLIQPDEIELIPRAAMVEAGDLTEAEAFFTLGHLQSPTPEQVNNDAVPETIRIAIVAIWLAGTLFFTLRMTAGFLGVRRLVQSGTSAPDASLQKIFDGLLVRMNDSRPVRLIVSSLVDVPMTVGWIRPCVIIPTSVVTGFPTHAVEALLAHELAHVRRYDYLVNLLQHVVEALFFYHPATWWLSRKIRDEREFCCDDQAIRLINNRAEYVKALAGLAEARVHTGLAPAATGSPLLHRIQRLVDTGQQTAKASAPAGLLTAIILVGLFTVALPMSLEAAERVIPRSALFQPNTRTAVKVSPDGEWISFRGAWHGTSNVWVTPRNNIAAARPVTSFSGRGVRWTFWSYSKDLILFMKDRQGEENWKLSTVNARTGEIRNLVDIAGVQVRVKRTGASMCPMKSSSR